MTIHVTGASDDLIEITGDINEEFSAPKCADDKGAILGFSDGTLLRIRYDEDGIWRIDLVMSGRAKYTKQSGSVEKDTFDSVTLTGDVKWVLLGEEWAKK